ncbi:hypothetical protein NKH63_30525 [Mesorhizobium sp. M0960]|uniref:hypothetical protein n=1 Tax=Mesorhizobium sp. M0960 TaxID=2957035 RepID=UPI00333DF2A9
MSRNSRDEADEELLVPSSLQSFVGHGKLGAVAAQQIVSDVSDGGEIGRSMVCSHPAFIVAEDAIHQPMQAFRPPMAAHDVTEFVGRVG